jgi:hypothetical protein
MNPNTFKIVPGSDKEYVDAFEKMRSEGAFAFEKATLGEFSDLPASEFQKNKGLQEVLAEGMRVFPNLTFHFPGQFNVIIARSSKNGTLFDDVTVNHPNQADQVTFAKLVASVQKHLGQSSLLNIGNLLGPAATHHFEAREIALARLETMSSTLLEEMEAARKRREQEFEAKEKALEAKVEQRQRELEKAAKARQEEQHRRASELETLQKELDDRAAKHARRQHYKDIKEKFKSWSEQFQVTKGTSDLRKSVFWMTVILLLLFGGISGYFLFQSITAQDNTHLIAAIVKQITFTLLFVSTALFFIRWNNQWFQRHANEEFRLKRMELDIDRASWFVEMAFEWRDEKGEEIPSQIIDRLTAGLFLEEGSEPSSEPHDSLAQALLGASRFTVKLSDGTEVEYDRKGVQKLLQEKRKS